jgi:hypothetical protein
VNYGGPYYQSFIAPLLGLRGVGHEIELKIFFKVITPTGTSDFDAQMSSIKI